ncbi:AGE family epimerase/isomerase [Paenibacillus sp. FSL K6-1230]|uniref:AGE family epimerase/isomerase n=1 Tax=Paenibacillus sp. FSL K6-1230 TaxID=2921603 RepID=UPI0030FCF373
MLQDVTAELRSEWTQHILPFWSRLKDERHGGFYGKVHVDLKTDHDAPKGGIATSRLLWTFSAAYRTTGLQAHRELADHAYLYLTQHLLDREYGGIYWMSSYDGLPLDTRKHIYAQAFAIYALSEYVRATGSKAALQEAQALFQLIENKGYDATNQAYREEFDRGWQEQPNEMLSENGVMAEITMNTHIHVLEAYTNLYRVWPDPAVRQALEQLLTVMHERIYDPEERRLGVFFDKQWNPLLDLTSFGHDIEASWLIDDTLKTLGLEQSIYADMVAALAYRVAESAIQSDGSLINEQEGSRRDLSRIWWVQAEGMVGFLNAFERTGDSYFLRLVEELWQYTRGHLIDPRPHGEWYWSIDATGTPSSLEIAGPWKCPYHNSRMCIEIIERMSAR